MITQLQRLCIFAMAFLLCNCAAITNVENVSRSLDVYELRPLTFERSLTAHGNQSLLVQSPTASATLSTDRIVLKPSELEVKYLPSARWTETAPAHFQRLLATSLTNSGGFGHVSLENTGFTPSFIVLSDLHAFNAYAARYDGNTVDNERIVSVSIRVTLTLVRDKDQLILATRTFESEGFAASDYPGVLIPAFDMAMQKVLHDVVEWVIPISNSSNMIG